MPKKPVQGELKLPKRYNSYQVSFWVNPTTHPMELEFVDILKAKYQGGYKPRDIIIDAVLYAKGRTPEMFDRRNIELEQLTTNIRKMLRSEFERSQETLLQEFGKQLIEHIKRVGIQAIEDNPSEDDTRPTQKSGNPFLDNFAASFLTRKNGS